MSRRGVYVFVIVVAAAAAGGCASSGATPRPFPQPNAAAPHTPTPKATPTTPGKTPTPNAPTPNTSASKAPKGGDASAAIRYSVTGTALDLRGAPYRSGGADPSGFDCSGFVRYVFAQHGITMPRKVSDQFQSGKDVTPSKLEPGDLVFFTTVAPGASHVGIALGGDEFVHAPSSKGDVRVERLSAAYWTTRFVGARRVL